MKPLAQILLCNVHERLRAYLQDGLHYHLAAEGVYAARRRIGDVFSDEFRPYIIAGMIAYDMARWLGKSPYRAFASRLKGKLDAVRPLLEPLMSDNLATVDLDGRRGQIADAYAILAERGQGGLNPEHQFHAGATKVLHWLNPELFLILDSHIATAFQHHPDPARRIAVFRARQPRYSAETYLRCLAVAQGEVKACDEERLRADGFGMPLAAIFGNTAFRYAVELEESSPVGKRGAVVIPAVLLRQGFGG